MLSLVRRASTACSHDKAVFEPNLVGDASSVGNALERKLMRMCRLNHVWRAFVPCAVVLVFATLAATLAASCSRRDGQHSVSPQADTLANGLPRALPPKLVPWVQTWRYAIPSFAPESLTRDESSRFAFDYAWPGHAGQPSEDARVRALIDVLSPDSARSLDFDMYLDFDRDEDGKIQIEREPDSAPVLADFRSDTLWRVTFCGTSCFYDGAYWVDAGRFALTGATQSGPQADGPWQPFLSIYDLHTRSRTEWVGRPVNDLQYSRYQSANDSALIARLEHAGFDTKPGPGVVSRVGPSAPGGP